MALQSYTHDSGLEVVFRDKRERHHSTKCQPRDIVVITPDLAPELVLDLREAICCDIRRGQGYPEIGLHKNLLWN